MQDAIYYIRWLRFAPLNTDEESEAFYLIMTLLTMSVGYTDRKRVIGPAVCFLLEKQMRWNPEQMGRLETYLVNINNDSLRQITEGHFSSQLDLLHEESLQLLDQVKQQQHPSLNDEEPLNIAINQVFSSVRTEHLLDGLAKFLFAKESSNADPWQQEAEKKMRLVLFF